MRKRTTFVLLVAAAVLWFAFAGRVLVRHDRRAPADAVFVLSGGEWQDRLATGLREYRRTGARELVVTMDTTARGSLFDLASAAERYLSERGVRYRIPSGTVRSTADEARVAAGLVRSCGWDRITVVSSPYHTRRASWIFRRAVGGEADVRVVPSGEEVHPGRWWASEREAEFVVLEWVKAVNTGVRYVLARPEPRAMLCSVDVTARP